MFASLRSFWHAFGSSVEFCDEVHSAIQAVNENCSSGISNGWGFSSAHSEFVLSMRRIGDDKVGDKGVLGTAIRQSRIFNEGTHVGFPMVFEGQSGSIATNRYLRDGFWVTPTKEEPQNPCKAVADAWGKLWETVCQVTRDKPKKPNCYLPSWLHQLSAEKPISTLDSAGLGLAMQHLTRQPHRDLPFGIGFTGRWQEELLGGVRGLQAKMEAAKEAGVFLLFACRDPDEAEPKPVAGVKVVLLPEGLSLDDIVREVNQVCADSGITEYRWRKVEKKLRTTKASSTSHTPILPEALDKSRCPWGFVGRELFLSKLNKAKDNFSGGRQLIALTAPPRSGKSTLLSHFASKQVPYPIWFSFQRDPSPLQKLKDLQNALTDQIIARFGVVALPNAKEESTPLENLIDALGRRIDLIVDGIDESESPKEVLKWLQQFPGEGLVTIGSQPLDFLEAVNGSSRIELQSNECGTKDDAKALINRIAGIFSKEARLEQIAIQLKEATWIDGLVEKSGGNLWILTEFLSAVEGDHAGWPNCPNEIPLSSDIVTYCEIVMKEALKDYVNGEDKYVRDFLMFLSFLGSREWCINDVLRVANLSLDDADWSGTGLLTKSVRRVLEFREGRCKFWSPLTHEAVSKNYHSTYADKVAERFIQLIELDEPQNELLNYLIESVPSLLRKVRNEDLTHMLLFKTPWLHLRLRGLLQLKELAEKKQKVSLLCADLASLMPFVSIDPSSADYQLIDWLTGWGWAIAKDGNLVNQWWDSAGDVTKPFPSAKDTKPVSDCETRLLAPIVGANLSDQRYNALWPTSPQFHPTACEILEGNKSHLVFVEHSDDGGLGGLLVYREGVDGYVRERFIKITEGDAICTLAPLVYPEVAALVQMPHGAWNLKVFDVSSGFSRTVSTDSQHSTFASLSSDIPKLLVVRRNPDDFAEGLKFPFSICAYDLQGTICAEMLLPFDNEYYDWEHVEVIPVDSEYFYVLGRLRHVAPEDELEDPPQGLILYRLQLGSSSEGFVEIPLPKIDSVNGACLLPNGELAVTHRRTTDDAGILSVINNAGKVIIRISLYVSTSNSTGGYDFHHETVGKFLLGCRPSAWHEEYGVILTNECQDGIYSVKLEHEAIPIPLETGYATPEKSLSLAGGRTLFLHSTGGFVLDPSRENWLCIEGGVKTQTTTVIIGSRVDGAILVSDWSLSPEGGWSLDRNRFAIPPCESRSPGEALGPNVCTTFDGWELGWSDEGRVLAGRKNAHTLHTWNISEILGEESDVDPARILDVIARSDQGGVWVAIKRGREVKTLLFPMDNQYTNPPRVLTIWRETNDQNMDVSLRDASGSMLVYRMIDRNKQRGHVQLPPHYGQFHNSEDSFDSCFDTLLHLTDNKIYVPIQNDGLVVHHLVGTASLIIGRPLSQKVWVDSDDPHALANVGVHFSNSEVAALLDLEISRTVMVIHREEIPGHMFVRLATIIDLAGRWILRFCRLDVDLSAELVEQRHVIDCDLPGEVVAWDRSDKYIVIAFATGRIELRDPYNKPDQISAVCYTTDRPNGVTVVRREEGELLAVLHGAISWFELP